MEKIDQTIEGQTAVTNKKISHGAYGGVSGDEYEPFVPASATLKELTLRSLVIGGVLAILFGAANTYLGLRVGLTVSASIPAAVLATALLRFVFRSGNILESNIIQTTASAGESIAGGIIFTLPALLLWAQSLTILQVVLASVIGGALGVVFVVPLRRYLTVEEHGRLAYPEGMAAAEVLVAGEAGGQGALAVVVGIILGVVYKFFSGALSAFTESPSWKLKSIPNGVISINSIPSLLGVGLIVGMEVGLQMVAGGLLAWLVIIPVISYFGAGSPAIIYPSTDPIAAMSASQIWSKYIRYIGAGAVATGGFLSLARSLPTIFRSFRAAVVGMASTKGGAARRTETDLPMLVVILTTLIAAVVIMILPQVPAGFIGAVMVVAFGFFFAAVSARIVGIVGVSNNPVSGMTIATLLIVSAVLKARGLVDLPGMTTAIVLGAMVCVAVAVGGGVAQNLKTTFIIGGTPRRVQIANYVGVLAASYAVGWVVLMLHRSYTMGSDFIPAPQATLMSMVVRGVITGTLPWVLVLIGVVIGICIYLLGLPVLTVALGLYLPLELSTGVLAGGILRWAVDVTFRKDPGRLKAKVEKGILLASGLIAGEALLGIVIAVLAYRNIDIAYLKNFAYAQNSWFALVVFLVLSSLTYLYVVAGND